ncbi:MAG: phage integrase N-terminal SAM-like domain-containing protein [Balneolaceae bacterium]
MRQSRMLSNYRTEFRRAGLPYSKEASALRWVRKFLNELSIDHASQIRHWQIDYYISELKKQELSYDELLHAKSSLRFLMDRVLKIEKDSLHHYENENPGVFRVTG